MIKQAIGEAGLATFAVVGLVVFVVVFSCIVAWVGSRGRREVATWSSLPLADGFEPVEPRLPIVTHEGPTHSGCGKCDDGACEGGSKTEPALAAR